MSGYFALEYGVSVGYARVFDVPIDHSRYLQPSYMVSRTNPVSKVSHGSSTFLDDMYTPLNPSLVPFRILFSPVTLQMEPIKPLHRQPLVFQTLVISVIEHRS